MERMNDYRTLGRTGLRVSPLGLGVMTYGWGADKQAAQGHVRFVPRTRRELDGRDGADLMR